MNQITDVTLQGVLFRAGLGGPDVCGGRGNYRGYDPDKLLNLHKELATLGWGISRIGVNRVATVLVPAPAPPFLYYRLEGRTPVPVTEEERRGGSYMTSEQRCVARTDIGDATISTVFLEFDHSYGEDGPPIVFETLVFGGKLADEMERYSTYAEAEAGHAAMVARVREAEG